MFRYLATALFQVCFIRWNKFDFHQLFRVVRRIWLLRLMDKIGIIWEVMLNLSNQ